MRYRISAVASSLMNDISMAPADGCPGRTVTCSGISGEAILGVAPFALTCAAFTQPLLARGIKISMDGRGRALDNVFVERLWRTVKYDEVYLKCYLSQVEAHTNLERFFRFYNDHRPHSAFGDADPKTPMQVYLGNRPLAFSA